MKRKWFIIVLAAVSALSCLFGFTACSGNDGNTDDNVDNEHTHNYIWLNDEFEHWRECNEPDCPNKIIDRGEHSFDEYGKCVCGYSQAVAEHKHNYVLQSDESEHWYECTEENCAEQIIKREKHNYNSDGYCECGKQQPVAEHKHNYVLQSDEYEHWYECTEENCAEQVIKREKHNYNADGYCECGKKLAVVEHVHDYFWVVGEEEHWLECKQPDCPQKIIGRAKHSYNADGFCECGKQQQTSVEHIHNYVYKYNDNEHWFECTNEGCTEKIINTTSHSYNGEGICICGYQQTGILHSHNYVWESDEGEHWQECTESDCPDKIINRGNHSFDINGYCYCGMSTGSFEFVLSGNGNSYILQRYLGGTDYVVIPEEYNGLFVESIGTSAFSGWTGLKSVTIPEKMKEISNLAFQNCYSLETINIPDSIKTIGVSAFENCEKLSEITIGKGVEHIGSNAFYGCYGLESITLEPSNLFYSTQNGVLFNKEKTEFVHIPYLITEITIPETIRNIAEGTFRYHSRLEKVVIPEGTESIGAQAFYGCNSLKSVIVPNSVTDIGYSAFEYCTALESITLPNSEKFGYVFGSSQSLDKSNVVPASLKEVIITGGTTVEDYAFYGCSGIEKITLPDGITRIGNSAFYGCSSLTEFVVPEGVTYLNNELFKGCSGLKMVTISKSLESIWNNVFDGCDQLVFNQNDNGYYLGTTENSFKAFIKPSSTDISFCSISPQASIIASAAFANCNNLQEVIIPDGVKSSSWLENPFNGCENIKTATGPADLLCLMPKISLQTIILTSGEYINNYMFNGFEKLENITIPASINEIEQGTFNGCSNIKKINITDLESWCKIELHGQFLPLYYGANLYLNDRLLTDLVIPDSVEVINDCTFMYCRAIESVVIPKSVQSIGKYAFQETGLKSITIPEGKLSNIGEQAFGYCSSLERAVIPNCVETMERGVFTGCAKLTELTIPFIGNTKDGTENAFFAYTFGATTYDYSYESVIPVTLKTVNLTGGSSIPDYAFYECLHIENIVIPHTVTRIGVQAFYSCNDMTEINLPSSVTDIADNAIDIGYLEYITVEEGNTAYSSIDGILYNKACTQFICIPSRITGNVEIPSGIQTIPDDAFSHSTLTGIILPESVTSIGARAFRYCTRLNTIVLPDGIDLSEIGTNAFESCENIISATLPAGLLSAIYKNKLQFVEITSGDTIPDSAFSHCSDLKQVILPKGVTRIGDRAFEYCVHLNDLEIPETVTDIGNSAFYYCVELPAITLPQELTKIGEETFSYCAALTQIEIPGCVTEI